MYPKPVIVFPRENCTGTNSVLCVWNEKWDWEIRGPGRVWWRCGYFLNPFTFKIFYL